MRELHLLWARNAADSRQHVVGMERAGTGMPTTWQKSCRMLAGVAFDFIYGQQHWLEEHRRQSHLTKIGDRWPDTATHQRLLRPCTWLAGLGYVRTPLGAANL